MDLWTHIAAQSGIALFLDFDGVVVDIAETPDAVVLTERRRAQLAALQPALDGALAIVSGRSLADIDQQLQPLRLAAAGDHGNERRRADGSVQWLNGGARAASERLAQQLRAATRDDPRLLVEHKPSAVALHYRRAPERQQACEELMAAATAGDSVWSVIAGKMVIEARAKGVSKGAAIRQFMQEPPFRGRSPLFLGDDVTDEDGFLAVQADGGAGVKVGPGDTAARFRIADTTAVGELLERVSGRARQPA